MIRPHAGAPMRLLLLVLGVLACQRTSDPDKSETGDPAPTWDACADTPTWSTGPELPEPRDHHATFVVPHADGATLWVAGGNDYTDILRDTWSLELGADGPTGEWEEGPRLPMPRAGAAVAEVDGRVILVAGRSATAFLDSVLVSEHDADGRLTGWTDGPEVPIARFHANAAVIGRTILVTGGVDSDGEATDTVMAATLGEDGTLSGWTELDPLPAPRSHHASFAADGRLYLSFGFSGNAFTDDTTAHHDVIAAPLNDDGTLGAWETVLTYDVDLSTHAATVADGCVLIAGGLVHHGGDYEYSGDLRRLDLTDGVGAPELLDGPTIGRSHLHQAPLVDGRLYLVGGSEDMQSVTGALEIGAF